MIDKKTQLAWLDKQRSIVNDMIVNLPPDEQGSLLPELQVINAIAERVRDMSAVEYLRGLREIRAVCLERIRDCDGCHFYNACPLLRTTSDVDCVAIVKGWVKDGH